MSDKTFGVHSETGVLRQVIVCRPGLAHRRLTPSNCDALLFDDVFWVKQAQKDGYRSRASYKLLEIQERDRLIRYCEQASLKTLVVPEMEELRGGEAKRSVREIRIEDLLGREEIHINLDFYSCYCRNCRYYWRLNRIQIQAYCRSKRQRKHNAWPWRYTRSFR